MGCCPQSAPRAVRAIPQGACHDARRQIGMTQSPVPTRNSSPHLGTRAVCPCLQFNTKTPHPISVCLEHAPEAATTAQTKYLWVIESKITRLRYGSEALHIIEVGCSTRALITPTPSPQSFVFS